MSGSLGLVSQVHWQLFLSKWISCEKIRKVLSIRLISDSSSHWISIGFDFRGQFYLWNCYPIVCYFRLQLFYLFETNTGFTEILLWSNGKVISIVLSLIETTILNGKCEEGGGNKWEKEKEKGNNKENEKGNKINDGKGKWRKTGWRMKFSGKWGELNFMVKIEDHFRKSPDATRHQERKASDKKYIVSKIEL